MVEDLDAEYPEAAPYIRRAVEEHGEAWVLDNYYQQLYPLGRLMDVPEKEELPFFDPEEHDTMTEKEVAEMYEAWSQYRENLRSASSTDNDLSE